jgi:hypothetical protein
MKHSILSITFLMSLSLATIIFALPACKKSNDISPATQGPVPTSFSPSQGMEGDTVVITGTGFSLGDSVLFNGVLAQDVFNVSAGSLTVLVPDGAATGKISVITGGKSNSTSNVFTVTYPPSARATVTKLADIPAYATNGSSGVRMTYAQNALYVTGPGTNQNAVYKLDLTTLGVTKFISFPGSPEVTAIDVIAGNPTYMLIGAQSGAGFYTYRYGILTEEDYSKTAVNATCNALRAVPKRGPSSYVATDYNNDIYVVNNATYGGNTTSHNFDTILNKQLNGIPEPANAMLGVGSTSGNIFVFASHTLWQLQSDNSLKTIAGSPGKVGYKDGPGSAALFYDGGYARGNAIAVDAGDNVFVADYGSGCIRKVDKLGNVTTVAGNSKYRYSNSPFTGPGNKMSFRFDSWDMVLAPDGTSLYVISGSTPTATGKFAVYKVSFQ